MSQSFGLGLRSIADVTGEIWRPCDSATVATARAARIRTNKDLRTIVVAS
jgi:hypothetical protein